MRAEGGENWPRWFRRILGQLTPAVHSYVFVDPWTFRSSEGASTREEAAIPSVPVRDRRDRCPTGRPEGDSGASDSNHQYELQGGPGVQRRRSHRDRVHGPPDAAHPRPHSAEAPRRPNLHDGVSVHPGRRTISLCHALPFQFPSADRSPGSQSLRPCRFPVAGVDRLRECVRVASLRRRDLD